MHAAKREGHPVREARADDTDAIIQLLDQSMGQRSLSRDHAFWHWKHRDSPFGESPCLIAEADGRMIGVRAFSRWNWLSDGRRIKAVRAVDTATHPDFQGQGIFSTLTKSLLERMKKEGVGFAFNTPNAKVMPGYLKLGWQQVGRVPLWMRPMRPLHLLRALRKPGETSDVSIDLANVAPVSALFDQAELGAFDLHQDGNEKRLHTERSQAYLRWRYADIPKYRYFAHWSLAGANKAALIFRGKLRKGARELLIAEILVSGSGGWYVAGKLLRELANIADADYAVACALAGSAQRQALMAGLFVPVPRLGPVFTARSISEVPDMPDLMKWSNWNCSVGDLEIF